VASSGLRDARPLAAVLADWRPTPGTHRFSHRRSRRGIRKSLLLHCLRGNAGKSCLPGTAIALHQGRQGQLFNKMLRITVCEYPGAVVVQLKGRVAVPWLLELEKFWLKTVASRGKPVLAIDLTGVTFVDAPGKAFLTAMHREGATFVAGDCLTKSIVEELTRTSLPDRGSLNGEGGRRPDGGLSETTDERMNHGND
jgi:hypothetical protein